MPLVGLRPGEKLFEEKLMAEEGLKKTKNNSYSGFFGSRSFLFIYVEIILLL